MRKLKLSLLICIAFVVANCEEQKEDKIVEPATGLKSAEELEAENNEEIEGPKLLKPENNSKVNTGKPVFEWTEIPGDGLYTIEIHGDDEMNTPSWDGNPRENKFQIEDKFMSLENGKTYFWRVKKGRSDWSETFSVTVEE